MFFKVIMWK